MKNVIVKFMMMMIDNDDDNDVRDDDNEDDDDDDGRGGDHRKNACFVHPMKCAQELALSSSVSLVEN